MAQIKNMMFIFIALISFIACSEQDLLPASVVREDGRTFIVDQTGYKWDITQAESIGFKPENFQYGMGKDAFTALDGSGLSDAGKDVPDNLRVIGVKKDKNSQAYSVQKLSGHEIANSSIASKPIAVGY